MTTTVESIFGSGRMVDGFFLNNQMTDFAFQPRDAQGRPAANAVAPGKRPRSSMTPVILLDRDGRFVGAIGSPGGNAILAYVAKALVGAARLEAADAAGDRPAQPVARGGSLQRRGRQVPARRARRRLRARGIELRPGQGEDSGLHGVLIRDGRLDGGADPRREGVVQARAGALAARCRPPRRRWRSRRSASSRFSSRLIRRGQARALDRPARCRAGPGSRRRGSGRRRRRRSRSRRRRSAAARRRSRGGSRAAAPAPAPSAARRTARRPRRDAASGAAAG